MTKTIRLNQELIYLKDKDSFQLKDLMETFHISKRTALRDIAALEEMGLALYSNNGRQGGYHLLKQDLLTPIYFSSSEIMAIFYALKALEKLSLTPFDQSYPQIMDKLYANVSQKEKDHQTKVLSVIDYYNITPINRPQFLSQTLETILEEKVVSISYHQKEMRQIKLQFFDLFYREGVWFSHAYLPDDETWEMIRSDYISSFQVVQNGQDRDLLSQLLERHEKDSRPQDFECLLTPFGAELFQKNHYETMTLEEKDGNFLLKGFYNPDDEHYLVHYLIEFGKHIKVLQPHSLKDAYLRELRDIIESYDK